MTIYKTLPRPVRTYGTETWTLTPNDERLLGIFEGNIICKIFGAINDEGHWRRRYNIELYQFFTEPDITFVKMGRLRWAGHMNTNVTWHDCQKTNLRNSCRKKEKRPRWLDGVETNLGVIKVKGWRQTTNKMVTSLGAG